MGVIMNNLLSYSGINTKVRAMDSNLISADDYRKIANLESTVDVIAFLKNHPGYREILDSFDERALHRGDAERIFINGLYLDYAKIYRFANITQRRVLDLIFFRYEVNILKSCIRLVYNAQDTYDLSIFSSFFSMHSDINVTALAASHTMDEYINNLKGTEYYPMFVRIQNSSHVTSFDYEMQLDIYYFQKSWKLKDKYLKGNNNKVFTRRFGIEIDLLNIMWIFRSKRVYDMNSGDIFAYMIPVNYKLSKDQMIRLVGSNSIDEFIAIIKTTYYKALYQDLVDDNVELAYENMLTKVYKENKAKYPASMATAAFYLYQKDTERMRLTTALECIRYGLEPQDKLKYIFQ